MRIDAATQFVTRCQGMAKTDAERKRKSRAGKVKLGYCMACGTEKPIPPKVTCESCIKGRYAEPKPLAPLRRAVTIDECREILVLLADSDQSDQAAALKRAANKVLGKG